MGMDIYVSQIAGYCLDKSAIRKSERVRGCKHELSENENKKNKFCPECGKPMWIEKKYNALYGDGVSFEFIEYGDAEDVSYAVGVVLGKDISYEDNVDTGMPWEKIKALNLDKVAEDIKKELSESGIEVNLKDFGVFSLVRISY